MVNTRAKKKDIFINLCWQRGDGPLLSLRPGSTAQILQKFTNQFRKAFPFHISLHDGKVFINYFLGVGRNDYIITYGREGEGEVSKDFKK